MITSKKDLLEYIAADSKNYQKRRIHFQWLRSMLYVSPISDQTYIWKYIKTMRLCEYTISCHNTLIGKIKNIYYSHRLMKYAYKTGFQIPPCVFDKGLTIWHWGMIIINQDTRIGENCTLHPNVIIGKRKTNGKSPVIGRNVYVCVGARILGDIIIGDNVTIAPNTVVFKNVPSNCVVAGNPAIIIKKDGQKVNIPL